MDAKDFRFYSKNFPENSNFPAEIIFGQKIYLEEIEKTVVFRRSHVENDPINKIDPTGLSDLVYDIHTGTISLYDSKGIHIGTWQAGNNVVGGGSSPLREGEVYNYSHYMSHSDEADPNGRFGLNGNFVFDVGGHSGVGVHSGRANRQGPNSATNGCIRTTDDATATIKAVNQYDPLQTLRVINSGGASGRAL